MAKGDNLTQIQTGLEPTDIEWLNSQNPGMGQRINHVLTSLGNVLRATGGHAGTVKLLKQKGKDTKGLVNASLDASEGRIENVQDPVLDLDAVNLRTLRRYLLSEEEAREEEPKEPKPECKPTDLNDRNPINTGLEVCYRVAVHNEFVYVLGEVTADGTVQVYRLKEDNTFELVATLILSETVETMVQQGRYLYLTKGSTNLLMVDIGGLTPPFEVSSTALGIGTRDVFTQGRWAYVAGAGGVKIVDCSVPALPVVRSFAV